MAVVCQSCGESYQPTADAPDCPKCSGATAAGADPAPRAARPATAAGAAPRRVAPKAPAAAGASAAKPAAPRRVAPAAAHGEAQPAKAPRATAAPARAAAARPAPHKVEHEPRVRAPHGGHGGEQPVLDDATRYGLFATLGFGLIVGIVCFFVFRSKAAREREREAFDAEVKQVYDNLRSLDLSDAASAERVIKLAGEKEATWLKHELAPDIESLVIRARSNLTVAKEKGAAQSRFAEIEAELAKPDVSSERLKELRRQLDESEARLADGGPELIARIAAARTKADQQYANRLAEEARSSATGSAPRAAIVRYQSVEDEIKSLLDRAYTAKNKEQQDFYTPLYKQVLGETDALAASLFQAEGETLPWIDCLGPAQEKNWNPSSVRGFSHSFQNGSLLIVGPDPDAGKMAVLSIGDREQWRHLQADIEFVIEKGDLDLFLRLGKGPNPNTVSYPLRTNQNKNLVAGKKYAARFSLIGSKLSVRFAGEDIDTPGPTEEALSWTINRKGALGFVIQPEAKAKFTKLQVRELR